MRIRCVTSTFSGRRRLAFTLGLRDALSTRPDTGDVVKQLFHLATAVTLPLVLVSCAQVITINDPVTHPSYVKNEELYAARNGSIRVEVDGDTFGLPREQFADLVVNRMRATYY